MTTSEAIQFLYGLQQFGVKLGLENILELVRLAGNPEQDLRFIHVAGTNGKGSTCAILESIYRRAGLKVGLFTSPHLIRFGERIQINRTLLSDPEILELVTEAKQIIARRHFEHHPTFFEVVTLMGLLHFRRQKCDLVIWETGLGGRFDATNIVTPLASVITNIQFDHEKWLGSTLEQIAFEKAGIIKHEVPVITGAQPPALAVIQAEARKHQAPLTILTPEVYQCARDYEIALLGEHQIKNTAAALATVRVLQTLLPVSEGCVVEALKTAYWPGRAQLVHTPKGGEFLLDGAHNPAGAEALRELLLGKFQKERTLVIGILKDKAWPEIIKILAPLANHILLCAVDSARSTDPHDLLAACREANPKAILTAHQHVAEAIGASAAAPLTVITGSLHFIGEAMEALNLEPVPPQDQRSLNEYKP